jgi:hypothetical protein
MLTDCLPNSTRALRCDKLPRKSMTKFRQPFQRIEVKTEISGTRPAPSSPTCSGLRRAQFRFVLTKRRIIHALHHWFCHKTSGHTSEIETQPETSPNLNSQGLATRGGPCNFQWPRFHRSDEAVASIYKHEKEHVSPRQNVVIEKAYWILAEFNFRDPIEKNLLNRFRSLMRPAPLIFIFRGVVVSRSVREGTRLSSHPPER